MVRRMAAVVLALTLNPTAVRAQNAVLTVTVASADVHKGPSTATPVIGHVSRGTVLPVSRNLGSWARVDWPGAPEGVAYVHVTMGRLGLSNEDASAATVSPRTSSAPAPATSAPASAETTIPPVTRGPAGGRIAVRGELTDTPVTHIFGVGGLVGSTSSFGATMRAWPSDHLGIQLAFTREAMTSDVAAGRVTSIRFEPEVVYALFDHVSDYVWIRPYVGSGLSVRHQTLKVPGRRPGVRDGQRHRISGLRGQRADVRGRAAVRLERGARIPSIPDAVPRIRARSAERVDRRTLVPQVRRGRNCNPLRSIPGSPSAWPAWGCTPFFRNPVEGGNAGPSPTPRSWLCP